MKKRICFRADANAQVGFGHFIRTLALADMLKEDFDCVFYTADPTPYQIGELQKVCPYVPLSDSTKLEDFLASLTGSEIVVLDNYFYTEEYQKQIKDKGCKLVCIDDMHDRHYYSDVVINHAYGAKKEDYSIEPYTQLCLGLNYALLRKPFLEKLTKKNRDSLLVCYGGLDIHNLTCKTLRFLETEIRQYHVDVIVGDAFKYIEELKEISGRHSNIDIHRSVPASEMASLMQRAKVAFLPASSVLWEAIFSGCNVVYGYYVDNQMDICKNVGSNQKLGLTYIGDLKSISAYSLRKRFKDAIDHCSLMSFEKPDTVSNFKALFGSDVTVREAKLDDAELYFEWANDPTVRQMAFHMEPIPWDSHIGWFKNKVASQSSHLLVCYENELPIGQVRFDISESGEAEIDISIAKEHRGKGLGKSMLKAAIEYEKCMNGIRTFVSEVKEDNISSNKMFTACGFSLTNNTNRINYYSLQV